MDPFTFIIHNLSDFFNFCQTVLFAHFQFQFLLDFRALLNLPRNPSQRTNWSEATRNKQHSTYACWTSNRFVTGGGREIIGRMMERERGRSKRISTNAFSRVCHTSRGKLSRLGWSQVKSETNECARKIFREDGGICPRMDGNEMNRILMARMGQDWSASRLTGQWECALTHPILLRPAETHIVRNAILSTRSDRLMKDITDEGAL